MVDGSQNYPIWVACRGNPDLLQSGDPKLARFIEQHYRAGVPPYLFYKPGAKTPEVLPQMLTPAMLSALAGGTLNDQPKGRTAMRLTAASCLFLLVLQYQPNALPAQTAPAKGAVVIDPQRMAAATELTEVIFAAQDVQHQLNSLIDGLLQQIAVNQTALNQFMDAHPAMRSELKAAWLPIFTRAASDVRPKMMREVAELYAASLSAEELREVTAFFKTPVGQRLLSGVQANMNLSNATAELAQGAMSDSKTIPDVSQASLDKDRRAAAVRSVASLSASDLQLLETASARPSMQKIAALGKQRGAIEAKWFNFSDPTAEKEIEKVTEAIITRYLKDPGK